MATITYTPHVQRRREMMALRRSLASPTASTESTSSPTFPLAPLCVVVGALSGVLCAFFI